MNYQYNQQPQQPQMPPPPVYVNAEEVKKRKKESFEKFSEKVADFCRSTPILSAVYGFSDILSYIVTGISVVMTLILTFLSSYTVVLCVPAILLGFFAISKKTVLPFAVAVSGVALADVVSLFYFFISRIPLTISLSDYTGGSYTAKSLTCEILTVIFLLVELAVLAYIIILAWQYFAATLPPRPVVPPMYGGQMPQQPPVQNFQQPPVQNFQQPQNLQQPPVQNFQQPQSFQQPPVQNFQQPQTFQQAPPPPPQPQPTAAKQCPSCGKENNPEAAFCYSCGSKF